MVGSLLAVVLSSLGVGLLSDVDPRMMDGARLRDVGRALVSHSDFGGTMPATALTDLYSLAAELARSGSNPFANPLEWFSDQEQEKGHWVPLAETVLARDGSNSINPDFRGAPVAWAVALLPSVARLPATTPVAWTRGLKADGTWREDSPNGAHDGSVFFLDGNVRRFRGSIGGGLVKWGTKEPTSDIMEALPPNTRISEYVPNPQGRALTRKTHWPELIGERILASDLTSLGAGILGCIGAVGVLVSAVSGSSNPELGRPANIAYGLCGLLIGLPVLALAGMLSFISFTSLMYELAL